MSSTIQVIYPAQDACYDRGIKVYRFLAFFTKLRGSLTQKRWGKKKNISFFFFFGNNSLLCTYLIGHAILSSGVAVFFFFFFFIAPNQLLGEVLGSRINRRVVLRKKKWYTSIVAHDYDRGAQTEYFHPPPPTKKKHASSEGQQLHHGVDYSSGSFVSWSEHVGLPPLLSSCTPFDFTPSLP